MSLSRDIPRRAGVAVTGNSAACNCVSFQSTGWGQRMPVASARFKYSWTVLTDIEQRRAIWR